MPLLKFEFLTAELVYNLPLPLLGTNRFKTDPFLLSTCFALGYLSELSLEAGRRNALAFSLERF